MADLVWKPKDLSELSEYEIGILARLNDKSVTSVNSFYNGTPCKLWTGSNARGHGFIRHFGRNVYCHRLSAAIYYNFSLESDLLICHHCDVRNCWEPTHLFAGTQKDNLQDALKKGRMANNWAKYQRDKTHCPQGHEYNGTNLVVEKGGGRRCRICKNAQCREAKRRQMGRVLTNV